jgi:hypothetical protein
MEWEPHTGALKTSSSKRQKCTNPLAKFPRICYNVQKCDPMKGSAYEKNFFDRRRNFAGNPHRRLSMADRRDPRFRRREYG